MGKIAGRPGHNELCRGAKAILDEVIEDRKIFSSSKKYLEKKHTFIDCTPTPVASQSQDLAYGVNRANNNKADFFYSVHLNKAYDSYDGAIGAEIWLYPKASQETINKANRILKNLENLGFKNRGIKYSQGSHRLYEIYKTNMEAMIIECFFLEATKDVEIYNRVGPDAIGFAIASGIDPSITKDISPAKADTKYGIVTADVLNVRAGRGTSYDKWDTLKSGAKVELGELRDGWYLVYYNGGKASGYVSAQYIRKI